MDINLLVLNLGNSRLAVGPMVAGELGEVHRIPLAQKDQWKPAIEQAWSRLSKLDAAVVAASVNPPAEDELNKVVDEVTDRRVLWVGKDIELPTKVLTETPAQTGVDRVINVAAAYEQMEKACVVVDAGTAITVSLCGDSGDFLGGAIFPGVSMMLDALHEKTACLPRVEFEIPTGSVGRSTEEAIRHGIYHGIRGMVKELTEQYAVELGQWPEIIATGGDAPKLFEGWELIHAIAPELTMYGIALSYTEHHLKDSE